MRNTLRTLVVAAAIAGTGALATAQTHSGHGSAQPQQHKQQHGTMQHGQMMQHHGQMMGSAPADSGSRQLHESMMAGMHDMQRRPMTGDVDKDFIRMMRQHHLQGIEMARIQLQKGDDPEAKRMAEKIIREQQKEIAQFDSWIQRHQ